MTSFDDAAADAKAQPRLAQAEALELAGYVSELAKAGLPLGSGLRAAAGDAESLRLGVAFTALARELEAGSSLEAALESAALGMPAHLRALMLAGSRSGQLHATLDELLAHERGIDDMTHRLWQASLYPATLALFFVAWVLFISWCVVPSMPTDAKAFEEMWGYLGPNRRYEPGKQLMEFAKIAPPLVLAALCAIVGTFAFARFVGGAATVSRIATAVPLYGRAWWNRSLVEFSGLLSIFLSRGLRLGQALELTAEAARDPAIRACCAPMVAELDWGRDLAACMADRPLFPPTLVAIVELGQANALVDTLRCARQMYADRFELQVRLARLIVPPIVFLLIGGSALFVAYGVFGSLMNIIKLITDLG